MKIDFLSRASSLLATAFILSFVACSKQPETPPAPVQTPPAATNAVSLQKSVQTAAADAKNQAAQAIDSAAAKAPETVKIPEPAQPPPLVATTAAPAQSPAQSVIDRVKALVAEKKYSEALAALSELSNTNLTVEQQNLVTQLKTQISNAMAAKAGSDAVKAVGGLLKQP